jgi:hypothetical protein
MVDLATLLKGWFNAMLGAAGFQPRPPPSARQRAVNLIAAVDAGGLPLNPARVNDIARQLGLEVSAKAPVEDTIGRIRAALNFKEI